MKKYSPIVFLFFFSSKLLNRLPFFANGRLYWLAARFQGFWLGILTRSEIQQADRLGYSRSSLYFLGQYNRSGLFEWEKESLERYFAGCKTLLVAGAGAGREVLALNQMGYNAHGFECNPEMVAFSRKLFNEEGMDARIIQALPDGCPQGERIYDGLIVGWCAYMHIQERDARISFLREMRGRSSSGAPILLSFWSRAEANPEKLKTQLSTANLFRRLLGRKKAEPGDILDSRGFVHFFTDREIEEELNGAGFDLACFSDRGHYHAVGIAKE